MSVMPMKRHAFLKTAALGGASLAVLPLLQRCAAADRPNIIFIMSDDHASHALSCYGSKINKTPNLDRLAKEGMRFTNSFCTNSICAPSRAVILTGKYSHLNGLADNRSTFDGSQLTFPKLLQQAGYETAMIGKWHLRSEPTGFDYYNVLPGQGLYHNPILKEKGKKWRPGNQGGEKYEGYVSDVITDVVLDWLKVGRQKDKPFMVMYHHKAPHRNWQPHPRYGDMYADTPLPETFDDDYNTRSDAAREQAMTIEHHLTPKDVKLTPPEGLTGHDLKVWKYKRYMQDYLQCVQSVDDNVGRLLDYLDETGLTENTVVVYTSDQGFYLGDHGWFDKRWIYEESLRLPLLVRYPREIAAGAVSDAMALNLDFGETFLDYAGVAVPQEMQGRSLRPTLQGKTPVDWRKSMYYHYYEYPGAHSVKRHYGVRSERYVLAHFYYDIDAWELYDLEKDPHELNNVYGDPVYAQVQWDTHRELERLRIQYGDSDELAQEMLKSDLEKIRQQQEARRR